jgi:hypothetical protein
MSSFSSQLRRISVRETPHDRQMLLGKQPKGGAGGSRSADPLAPPMIAPNYLATAQDRAVAAGEFGTTIFHPVGEKGAELILEDLR